MLVGWPIASAVSGRLMPRIGTRPLVRAGAIVAAAASLRVVTTLHQGASLLARSRTMFLLGIGLGTANTALLIAVQQSVIWQQRGVATASTMFFRTIGGALAVGALGRSSPRALGPDVPTALLNELLGPEHGRGLDAALLAELSGQLRGSLRHVFDVIAALSVASLGAGLVFPQKRLAQPDAQTIPTAAGE